MPTPRRPLYLITDCETTGLDYTHDEAYEIAMIGYDGVKVLFRRFMWVQTTPGMVISRYTSEANNYHAYLSGEQDHKTPEEARILLTDQIRAGQYRVGTNAHHTFLVGSNPSFDKTFIQKATKMNLQHDGGLPGELVSHKMIDLSNLAMVYFRSHEPIGQAEIQKRLYLSEQTHGAQQDAEDALQCFITMTRGLMTPLSSALP